MRILGLIISSLALINSNRLPAETEPGDNDFAGAGALVINTPATGQISNSDDDYYKITNTDGAASIRIDFSFGGSSPDYHYLAIYDQNKVQIWMQPTDSNTYSSSYTITGATKDAVYYVVIGGGSADGSSGYDLSATAAPEIEVTLKKDPASPLGDDDFELDCGNVRKGKIGKARTFVIKNTGSTALTGLETAKGGKNKKDFKVGQPKKDSLAPGETTIFTVTFAPKKKGLKEAAMMIFSNDEDEDPFDIKLTGMGKK